MIFFPAIDLKDGHCVRLLRGQMDAVTVFNENPTRQAATFESAGCKWLHLVDLNGAFEGRPVNGRVVDAILQAISIPVELGGGIRDRETIAMWLEKGVARVILGTAAVRNPTLVRDACRAYPGQVVLGIDAKDGYVAVEGWAETAEIIALDLARQFEDAGAAALIYTDIARDGAMRGPNIDATLALADSVSIPVILSGGVASISDLASIKAAAGNRLEGVISGRAVYDGQIDVAAATALLAGHARC